MRLIGLIGVMRLIRMGRGEARVGWVDRGKWE